MDEAIPNQAGAAGAFTPPTAEQVQAWIARHPMREASAWLRWGPWLVLGGAVLLMLVLDGAAALIVPWAAIAGLFIFAASRARSAASLGQRTVKLQEATMLRHYPVALRSAWRMLPDTVMNPALRSRVMGVMAVCLDQLRQYDAAMEVYDALLSDVPNGHPAGMELRVRRAIAALSADHLADADDALRRVRHQLEPHAGTPLGAGFTFAQLLQHVRTHHFADAVAMSPTLLDDLRPLGVEAGYGHALMALCFQEAGADAPAAQRWWDRATTLLPAAALVGRYPELAPMMEQDHA